MTGKQFFRALCWLLAVSGCFLACGVGRRGGAVRTGARSRQVAQPAPTTWRNVQQKSKDTVVQIFVQAGSFNWLQPYKSPDVKKSFGSGFFVDNQGHILTNFHVVDEAYDIKIQIPSFGKEQFEASVVGVCPDRDVALLKLSQEAQQKIKNRLKIIPFLDLGDSDKVVRTQEILTLGYPLGQEKLKSTQGIVSGREMVWGESYLQVTAALNPGNSGGPSLSSEGKVVGINTARMATAQNIGYIIPINDIKSVIKDLYHIKLLRCPQLGCEFNYATAHLTKFLKNPMSGGLYISRVYSNSLMHSIGVREGDMIESINNQKLDMFGETNVGWSEDKVSIVALLNRFKLGQDIKVAFYRKGQRKETSVKFARTAKLPIRKCYPVFETIDYEIIGGMVVMPLTLNHIEKFANVDKKIAKHLVRFQKQENQQNAKLIVTHVFPTSQAQEARCIRPGDLLTMVNGQKVGTLQELRDALGKSATDDSMRGFMTFKTDDRKFMVLEMDHVLKDETKLSKQHMYHQTKAMSALNKLNKESKISDNKPVTRSKKLVARRGNGGKKKV